MYLFSGAGDPIRATPLTAGVKVRGTSGRRPGPARAGSGAPPPFDAATLLFQAVRAAGKTDSDAVVKALEAGAFPGVAGTYRFDASHQAVWGTPELHGNVIRWEPGGARIVFPVPEKR